MTFNSYKRVSTKENKFNTFQDQEKITALDLNWIHFKWRNHDPTIGRFFNLDPLAENYFYNAPYVFSENRVLDGIELEGLEWKSIKDEKNNTQVNTIQVKVVNNSSMSNSQGMGLVMDIMTEAGKTFSGIDADGTQTITIASADFELSVNEGDFYMELKDDIELKDGSISTVAKGRTEEIGNTTSNHIQINAENAMDPRDYQDVVRSGVHELGHTADLTHSNPSSSSPGKDDNGIYLDKNNLMLHGSNKKEVNSEQLKRVNNTVDDKKNSN